MAEDDDTKITKYMGTDQHDALVGTDADEMFLGLEGLDGIEGRGGNDILNGGPGGDALLGGDGDDTYLYNLGDQGDIIQDAAGSNDVIKFGVGITPESLTITEQPTLLSVVVGDPADKDRFLIRDWGILDNFIEKFVFDDGTELNVAEIESRIQGNRRPEVLRQIPDQVATVDMPFRLEVTQDIFRDPEGASLTFYARSQGSRLLSDGWLDFDSTKQIFYGTPSKEEVAETTIILTARDSFALTSRLTFKIKVALGE